jgi:TnpA family transposase
LLRRLGTHSRKNRLYLAFRELGRAVRTLFLLEYINDIELRRQIHGAINKSEGFNHFVQWVAFGGHGVIAENGRDEQRKNIKYNHLVANCLIFYNVQAMTQALRELGQAGQPIEAETLQRLSPCLTEHINRFGDYSVDIERNPPEVNYHLNILNILPFKLTPPN